MARAGSSINRGSTPPFIMKELISFLLQLIFGPKSKEIDILITPEENGQLITLAAPEELLGQLIGRAGQTARALKILLALQSKGQQSFRLDIKKK